MTMLLTFFQTILLGFCVEHTSQSVTRYFRGRFGSSAIAGARYYTIGDIRTFHYRL
jgi:hypothetical protein